MTMTLFVIIFQSVFEVPFAIYSIFIRHPMHIAHCALRESFRLLPDERLNARPLVLATSLGVGDSQFIKEPTNGICFSTP